MGSPETSPAEPDCDGQQRDRRDSKADLVPYDNSVAAPPVSKSKDGGYEHQGCGANGPAVLVNADEGMFDIAKSRYC